MPGSILPDRKFLQAQAHVTGTGIVYGCGRPVTAGLFTKSSLPAPLIVNLPFQLSDWYGLTPGVTVYEPASEQSMKCGRSS